MASLVGNPGRLPTAPRDTSDAVQLTVALDELSGQIYAALGLVADMTSQLFGVQIEKETQTGRSPARDGVVSSAIDKARGMHDVVVGMSVKLSEITNRLRT